jgi:hypothetical protein
MKNNREWAFSNEVARMIFQRLRRALILEDLSVTTLEQLHYLAKCGTDKLLTQALNEALTVS